MLKRCIAFAMVIVCLSCLTIPAFAVDPITFSEQLFEGLFWSTSRAVGIQGELLDALVAQDDKMNNIGIDDVFDNFLSWFTLEEAQIFWNSIKSDIRALGTVKYTSRREVPQYGINITSSNNNDVRLWTKKVQDFWKTEYNVQTESEWTSIDEVYGGYLSYAEGFTGISFLANYDGGGYVYNNYTPYDDTNDGFSNLGLDIYQRSNSALREILHFDPTDDSITVKNYPLPENTYHWGTGGHTHYAYFYYSYPVSLSASASLSIDVSQPTGNPDPSDYVKFRWYQLFLISASDYENAVDYIENHTGSITDYLQSKSIIYSLFYAPDVSAQTAIINSGDYYIMAVLQMAGSSRQYIFQNQKYYPQNNFSFTIDQSSHWDIARLYGIPRTATWSVDITDSGTGTSTTVPDAVSTIYSDILTVPSTEEDEQILYFPSAIEYVPDLVDVMNTDYAVTGEVVHTVPPSSEWPEGVTIELQPPTEINIFSIWHYVRDSYNYVVDYLNDLIYVVRVIPTPITNITWATVVVGIIFGLYRRFME